ncbi:hypothetical protein FN846DRAFT_1021005 [Sphaerosporella brunnea]|uniref:BZIP domain-containing protein n=1 Tax=Sphaerosporella brunnea TaxID=1250544 RepID=A0A5J5EZH8_9PEZI|nr:hypothetical protein FN846DRAFT_1021005 [Sphaerosporella brunnea]
MAFPNPSPEAFAALEPTSSRRSAASQQPSSTSSACTFRANAHPEHTEFQRPCAFPSAEEVSEIVNGLGYNTSPASFSHRSPVSSYPTTQPHPDLQYRQPDATSSHQSQQSPILDPHLAARYYNRKVADFAPHRSTMTQDQMKIVDPDIWGEDLWATTPELGLGSEFSPLIGTDLCGTTVSPSEVTMNPSMPTPTFSSPYLFDSPSEGYETSPLFGAEDTNGDNWYSLFPEVNQDSEDSSASAAPTHQAMIADIIVKNDSRESTASPETSPKFSDSTRMQKRSSTSGVRKRQQPLPPIVVEDPSDIVALKRARNTLAARKSRAKKAEKMDEMEAMIEDLKAQVEHWKNIALSKGAGV